MSQDYQPGDSVTWVETRKVGTGLRMTKKQGTVHSVQRDYLIVRFANGRFTHILKNEAEPKS